MSSVSSHLVQFQSAALRFYARLWFQHTQNHRNCACDRFIVSKWIVSAGRAEKTEDRLPSEHRPFANEWRFHSEKSFVGELIGKFDSFDSKLDYVSIMCSWNWFFRTWLVSNTKMANSKETFSIGSRWSPSVSLQRANSVCLWLFRGQLLDIWTNRPGRRLISQKFAASRRMAYSPSRYASLYTEACPPRRSILMIIRRFENIKSFVYLAIERYMN